LPAWEDKLLIVAEDLPVQEDQDLEADVIIHNFFRLPLYSFKEVIF
jgi:hypothetical protein